MQGISSADLLFFPALLRTMLLDCSDRLAATAFEVVSRRPSRDNDGSANACRNSL